MRTLERLEATRWTVLALVTLLYYAVGFYPYQLPPYKNGASLIDGRILRFDAPGIAYTPEPPAWLTDAIKSTHLHVALDVHPADRQSHRWARILAVSANRNLCNFSIGQSGYDLIVRVRDNESDPTGNSWHAMRNVFKQPGLRRIELSILPGRLTVAVDGQEILQRPLPHSPLSNWSSGYALALGNELSFDRPWLGTIHKAAISAAGQIHDYTRPGALTIPDHYSPPLANRYMQLAPFSDRHGGNPMVVDKLVNLFGFMPFGTILALLFRRTQCLPAFSAACCALSLSIEAGQLFLAPRTPSIDDLLLNTLGGTAGAWMGMRMRLQGLQRTPE